MKIIFDKRDLNPILKYNYKDIKHLKIFEFFNLLEPHIFNFKNTQHLNLSENEIENLKNFNFQNIYILNNKNIIFIFNFYNFIKIIQNNFMDKTIEFVINKFNKISFPKIYIQDINIVHIYNIMRNKYFYLPIFDKNTEELLGELLYQNINKKFFDGILIDKNLNVYHKEFFELIKNNNELFENINFGLIGIKLNNLNIFRNFYGQNFINKILIEISNKIKYTLRRIDMIFYINGIFFAIVFDVNSKNILNKIEQRIIKNLKEINFNNLEYDFITTNVFIPGEEKTLFLAENKIIYKINKKSFN